jgi:acyl carrier protein
MSEIAAPSQRAESQAGPWQSKTEETVAGFWQELLETEVHPDNCILDLGGNSLIATMLANRIEETFGFRPSMEDLFSCTLREMAALCDRCRGDGGHSPDPA